MKTSKLKLNDNDQITPFILDQIQTTCTWLGIDFNRHDLTITKYDESGKEIKYFINYVVRRNGRRVIKISNMRKGSSENFGFIISACMFLCYKFKATKNPFNVLLSAMPDQIELEKD